MDILRIGIPNRGRLSQLARQLFITIQELPKVATNSRLYHYSSIDGRKEFIFARSTDLPRLLEKDKIHLCVTGNDYLLEKEVKAFELLDLNVCSGHLSILIPEGSIVQNISDLEGFVFATQLPNLTNMLLYEHGLRNYTIYQTDGANEVYPKLGLVDATVDVVSTGQTAAANHLVPFKALIRTSGRLFTTEKTYQLYKNQIDELIGKLKPHIIGR